VNSHNYLSTDKITGRTAKKVLAELFASGLYKRQDTAKSIICREGWWFTPLSEAEYEGLAKEVLDANGKVVEEILAGKQGKVNFLVGQMMRGDQDGRVDASRAREVVMKLIEARKS